MVTHALSFLLSSQYRVIITLINLISHWQSSNSTVLSSSSCIATSAFASCHLFFVISSSPLFASFLWSGNLQSSALCIVHILCLGHQLYTWFLYVFLAWRSLGAFFFQSIFALQWLPFFFLNYSICALRASNSF